MDKKVTYAIIAIVAIVVIAGVAYAVISGDDSEKVDETADDVTFLIQDDDGVYFWAFGEGATVIDAFKNAVESYEMPFTASKNKEGADDGIGELFGLKMTQVDEKWFWWTQFTWTDDAWVQSNLMMDKYTPEEAGHFVACVYGDGTVDPATLVKPKDAVVWDKDTAGIVITIQNGDNLFFKVNAEGATVYDAFKAMTEEYKISFTPSEKNNVEYGIDELFGLEKYKEQVGENEVWHFWGQYYKNPGEDWDFGQKGMNETPIDMYDELKVTYQ